MSDILTEPKKMRARTFLEMQPYIVSYGAAISVFSPLALIYMVGKLNPQIPLPLPRMLALCAPIFPIQTILKTIQMNASTPLKEHFNPWVAFAAVGVLQGGVYGQANIYFSEKLGINKNMSLRGMFRGAGFAGCRDTISQGVPFVCSKLTKKYIFERINPTNENSSPTALFINQWGSILSTSIVATYMSQFFMNLQTTMQTNPELTHLTTLKKAQERYGVSIFYRGAEARVGLLLVVNVLNELLLKPAWSPVEDM